MVKGIRQGWPLVLMLAGIVLILARLRPYSGAPRTHPSGAQDPVASIGQHSGGSPSTIPEIEQRREDPLNQEAYPERLRQLLRSGQRDERIAAMVLMIGQDREAGEEQFRTDILTALNDEDFIVSMAATQFSLRYSNSEIATDRNPLLIPSARAGQILLFYQKEGNYTAWFDLGNTRTAHVIPTLELGLELAGNSPDGNLLALGEAIFNDLRVRGDLGPCMMLGRYLAQHGRWVGRDLAVDFLRSGDSSKIVAGAEFLFLSKDSADLPVLRETYDRLAPGSPAKENLLFVITGFPSGETQAVLLDLLLMERESERQEQVLRALAHGGMPNEDLSRHLHAHSVDLGGNVRLPVTLALAKLGDRTLLPAVREHLRNGVASAQPEQARIGDCIRILGTVRDLEAVPLLGRILTESNDADCRKEAGIALTSIGNDEARAWLDGRSGNAKGNPRNQE